jgi:hypothetical protein
MRHWFAPLTLPQIKRENSHYRRIKIWGSGQGLHGSYAFFDSPNYLVGLLRIFLLLFLIVFT